MDFLKQLFNKYWRKKCSYSNVIGVTAVKYGYYRKHLYMCDAGTKIGCLFPAS
jgi:hypothetical protein